MRQYVAIAGSSLFFVLIFGVVIVFVPWHFTHWHLAPPLLGFYPFRIAGALLILAGLPVFVDGYLQFGLRGLGTPAPVAPPSRLVVTGFYAHVRNPMYLAIVSVTLGQGLIFDDGSALRYPLYLWVGFSLFVYFYEEPALRRRFGVNYERYRAQVPRWIPRVRPYRAPLA